MASAVDLRRASDQRRQRHFAFAIDNQSLLSCCVDLDRSAVNTRSNAAETRRWARERGFKSLIV